MVRDIRGHVTDLATQQHRNACLVAHCGESRPDEIITPNMEDTNNMAGSSWPMWTSRSILDSYYVCASAHVPHRDTRHEPRSPRLTEYWGLGRGIRLTFGHRHSRRISSTVLSSSCSYSAGQSQSKTVRSQYRDKILNVINNETRAVDRLTGDCE